MRIVLLGAPGAGKGSQAKKISEKYNLPHISTGDIFRSLLHQDSELGRVFAEYSKKGLLVPDDLVIKIVEDRLNADDCKNGFIMDGFPRTIPQAEAFEKDVHIDVALNFDVDKSILMDRLTGRWTCSKCGAPYHVSTMNGITKCTICGGDLVQRDDDKAETVEKRLVVYETQTKPLIDFYKKVGVLQNLDANKPIEEVFEKIVQILDNL